MLTMKFLKKLGILLITLIALVLIIALFVKKDYHVSRSVEVSVSNADAFDYVRYLRSQDEFAVWQAMDPNVKQTYSGEDGSVGAIYKWDSKVEDVGAGEQEIMKIDDGKRIDFELRFTRPWEMTGDAYMTTEPLGDSKTKVTWAFEGSTPWPWNFFFLFMDMDGELGPDLQKGLDNLKQNLESQE